MVTMTKERMTPEQFLDIFIAYFVSEGVQTLVVTDDHCAGLGFYSAWR